MALLFVGCMLAALVASVLFVAGYTLYLLVSISRVAQLPAPSYYAWRQHHA